MKAHLFGYSSPYFSFIRAFNYSSIVGFTMICVGNTAFFSAIFFTISTFIYQIDKTSSHHTSPHIHIEWDMPVRQPDRTFNDFTGRYGAAAAEILDRIATNKPWESTHGGGSFRVAQWSGVSSKTLTPRPQRTLGGVFTTESEGC